MVSLWNRARHYIFALWFLFIFFFFSSPSLSGRRLDVYHTATHGVALVRIYIACLKFLHAKKCHFGTIGQICRAVSSQLRHESTIRKKLVKQQYLLHMSSQCSGRQPNCAYWTEGATYIQQGRHHVGHWPTFLLNNELVEVESVVLSIKYLLFISIFAMISVRASNFLEKFSEDTSLVITNVIYCYGPNLQNMQNLIAQHIVVSWTQGHSDGCQISLLICYLCTAVNSVLADYSEGLPLWRSTILKVRVSVSRSSVSRVRFRVRVSRPWE